MRFRRGRQGDGAGPEAVAPVPVVPGAGPAIPAAAPASSVTLAVPEAAPVPGPATPPVPVLPGQAGPAPALPPPPAGPGPGGPGVSSAPTPAGVEHDAFVAMLAQFGLGPDAEEIPDFLVKDALVRDIHLYDDPPVDGAGSLLPALPRTPGWWPRPPTPDDPAGPGPVAGASPGPGTAGDPVAGETGDPAGGADRAGAVSRAGRAARDPVTGAGAVSRAGRAARDPVAGAGAANPAGGAGAATGPAGGANRDPAGGKIQEPAGGVDRVAVGRVGRASGSASAVVPVRARRDGTGDRLAPGVRVEARVLGPVEVVGWRQRPERHVVTELCCYLALHAERPVPGDVVLAALWPEGGREAGAKSLRTYLSLLRRSLGPDLFPEAGKGAGYQLDPAVATDWDAFCALVADAGRLSARGDDATAALVLRRALQLVRGTPFAGVAPGTYSWAWTELLVSGIERAVAGAALRLAGLAAADGDHELADWAARRGLRAVPFDEALWASVVATAGHLGSRAVTRAVRDRRAVLGEAVGGEAGGTDRTGGPVIDRGRGLAR